jgi:hypothetical protein
MRYVLQNVFLALLFYPKLKNGYDIRTAIKLNTNLKYDMRGSIVCLFYLVKIQSLFLFLILRVFIRI